MDQSIKVGFCIAYDWYFLKYSLPLIYKHSTHICLSLDVDRLSWSGHRYAFDEEDFRNFVAQIDVDKKILIVEENYHLTELTPMQNEVRQRNLIATHLGAGGWHIQLDCDEYFLEFSNFVDFLRSLPLRKTRRANVCCPWLVLYKQIEKGFLVIDPVETKNLEYMQIATREPLYEYGRRNGNFNIYTNFRLVHQSWARTENEISEKVQNWGHSNQIDGRAYFATWKSLTESNYKTLKNFHFLVPSVWPKLVFVACLHIEQFLQIAKEISFPRYSIWQLYCKNSRVISKFKSLLDV